MFSKINEIYSFYSNFTQMFNSFYYILPLVTIKTLLLKHCTIVNNNNLKFSKEVLYLG